MRLLEDQAKAYLHRRGLPVPRGAIARTPEEAYAHAAAWAGRVAVKALVATGRRGKAGAVRICDGADQARDAAVGMLGTVVADLPVSALYVEEGIDIGEEYFLSMAFDSLSPQLIVSRAGGIDIETAAHRDESVLVRRTIDPARGLTLWQAIAAWDEAGVPSDRLQALGELSVKLYEAFRDADALMLEINPLAVRHDGSLSLVGTMLEVDDNALFRHQAWRDLQDAADGSAGRVLNERERAVLEANRTLPGASVRYTELDGDIGLMVSGGGAGLLQHDLVLAAGGRPSCHTDMSPAPTPEKPAALIEAIISNPNVRGLLIGFNRLQLAPCDLIAKALLMALERRGEEAAALPIVVRLQGPNEDEARQLLAGRRNIDYLPSGASLSDGVRRIVDAVNARKSAAQKERQ